MPEASKFSALSAQEKADTRDAIRGYKVYSGLLTIICPELTPPEITMIIRENTIGNIVWSPSETDGLIIFSSDNLFVENKTMVFIGTESWDSADGKVRVGFDGESDGILFIYNNSGEGDFINIVTNTAFEIRVYL